MDWWTRLIGNTPRKPIGKTTANDPQLRFAKFKCNYDNVLALCNQPRNLATEDPLLVQLHGCLERIAALIREESRAAAPHYVLQFVATNKIYTVIARAATVSQYEPIICATVSILGALVDSEEEDFLYNAYFAKSVMRMSTKIIDGGTKFVTIETETAILELLFTITTKIRLQPDLLPNWFHSTFTSELEDVFVGENKGFVGITAKEDFPLCYLLVDRVYHEGRLGDFARTGMLYIFEATGLSPNLEQWVVSSDLPTLMASGLGALYSQLSRELSILHPDATLPAVLAMSDYSTTHPRATAESAFSERHKRHMSTFLSYLAFWQDILDHCKSTDVKQTLLDHFQILFLRQLLYPSLLQSSDTDAGSSVAVLTYVSAMLESLEYPDLVSMMLEYLLDVESSSVTIRNTPSPNTQPQRSPTALRRKQSLLLLTAPKDPDDAVEPALFNLVDLVLNNILSSNSQSAFAALRLASTILTRQKRIALGTLLRVQRPRNGAVQRKIGALELEVDKYMQLAESFHKSAGLQDAYGSLAEDMRIAVEAQVHSKHMSLELDQDFGVDINRYIIPTNDHFMRALSTLLRTFLSNSVDVNLALSQTIVSVALCIDIRLDSWLALDPSSYSFDEAHQTTPRSWESQLDDEERESCSKLQQASHEPQWTSEQIPLLFTILQRLTQELSVVCSMVKNIDHLISVRKDMLQAPGLDTLPPSSKAPSPTHSPAQAALLDVRPGIAGGGSPWSSRSSSLARGRREVSNISSPKHRSPAASPMPHRASDESTSSSLRTKHVFQPPPAEVPSTTDILMQQITLANVGGINHGEGKGKGRSVSLNHLLTNIVILQEFALELVAILQVRAAVLAESEVRLVRHG